VWPSRSGRLVRWLDRVRLAPTAYEHESPESKRLLCDGVRGTCLQVQQRRFNGPGGWPRLESLPETNQARWDKRIRSVRVGASANVVAFVERGFRGRSERFTSGSEHPTLSADLSANIESLELTCGTISGAR
jgi:hypothetical protein